MPLFMVDVEADGPCPGLFSMVGFAAMRVDADAAGPYFTARLAPISERYLPHALKACNTTREQQLTYADPQSTMREFVLWLSKHSKEGRPVVISDNPAFDFSFLSYYLWAVTDSNPFGHSARRIGDFAAGLERDFFASSRWKRYRKTPHSHDPLDDVRGNVEALLELSRRHGIRLPGHVDVGESSKASG